ncbi:DNA polymerase III subunit gamma/tau [Pelagicoccus sp. SDUM812003]|uniref:DNA polymerase III subunit gamma/tau n=1 Tax=Pelagicoccus sp. SDUM812003 TaxID=3041267 RepID=UPI00280ECD53|nr:DNA polymerase III subunit gamma/tau [Pelagicoccus sp. SDUM812003]MDQ8204572.1 DNA polymerase III subunit gamma/tau [Pelagicoccus sp. SDUM812003]
MSSEGYQVIARKWRPQKFDDVVGQEHVVRTLKNAIEQNRIAHAYLFVGPRGTGKTTTARIFAKCLNCEGGPLVDPPEDSEICKAIMNGSCMDVLEIDGASNNGVEQVRALREDAQYAPSQGKFKVYIIDEVHMLSTGAFNALLKILEEPPAHVKFVFATTEAHKVLPTIVSRCQRFDLKPIPEKLIQERLAFIAKAEGIEADDAALSAVARLADGGMRDSQSILDQLIAFCGKKITEADVLQVYGLVSADDIDALAIAIATGDHPRVLELSDQFDASGQDFYRALVDLQARVRHALIEAVRGGGQTDSLGTPLSTESLTRLLDSLRQSESGLKFGLTEKVNFEVALLKASEECRARAIDSLIRELSSLAENLPETADEKKNG